ncbi:MAG: TolC family protein [Deltaproteobacteria bacterium]|nr:TolC family protein [Deltaproteobacteria bacterium]
MHLKVFLLSLAVSISFLLLAVFCLDSLAQNPAIQASNADRVPHLSRKDVIPDGGILTLRRAVALALQYNPELKASSWEERAMEGRVIQAGLLPNPEIEAETENFGGSGVFSGFDAAETTVQLSQLIELGGKRAKRSASAAFSRDLAEWDYRVRHADVLADVAMAFVDVLSAQERVTLMNELLHLAEEVFNTTAERVKAGKISPVEEIKARVERAARQIDLKQAAFDLKVARRRLSGAWGGTAATFEEARGNLDDLQPIPSWTTWKN